MILEVLQIVFLKPIHHSKFYKELNQPLFHSTEDNDSLPIQSILSVPFNVVSAS